MKKGLLLLVIGVALLSCEKQHTCQCDYPHPMGWEVNEEITINAKPSKAEKFCEDGAGLFNEEQMKETHNCYLK
jgi:hypothetical protein